MIIKKAQWTAPGHVVHDRPESHIWWMVGWEQIVNGVF